MTESEAKGFVQGKLDCMNKCDIFNKEDNTSDNDCDNCQYCYSQGTFGEQKEAFSVAINALEKQIAQKPIFTEDKQFALCPSCDGKGLTDKQKYCDNCGQTIDWSNEE